MRIAVLGYPELKQVVLRKCRGPQNLFSTHKKLVGAFFCKNKNWFLGFLVKSILVKHWFSNFFQISSCAHILIQNKCLELIWFNTFSGLLDDRAGYGHTDIMSLRYHDLIFGCLFSLVKYLHTQRQKTSVIRHTFTRNFYLFCCK